MIIVVDDDDDDNDNHVVISFLIHLISIVMLSLLFLGSTLQTVIKQQEM